MKIQGCVLPDKIGRKGEAIDVLLILDGLEKLDAPVDDSLEICFVLRESKWHRA